jgi:hypothetical protein
MAAMTRNGPERPYFNRPAEKLVIEGYRHWHAVEAFGRAEHWQAAVRLYCGLLGRQPGARALADLAQFVETLERCAACPLRALPFGDGHLNREEALVIGLVAGIQHGDEAATRACLDGLTCASRCDEVEAAAGRFAVTLKASRHLLVPVPRATIEDILYRAMRPTRH